MRLSVLAAVQKYTIDNVHITQLTLCLWSSLPACCFIIEIMTGVLYSQFVILCF